MKQLKTIQHAVTQSTCVRDLVYNYSPEVTLLDYLKNPSHSINSSMNVTNSIKGFLDVMYYQQKLPQTFSVVLLYKFNLVLFYLINFVYQVVTLLVIQDDFGYYITCIIISCAGLVSGAFEIMPDVCLCKEWLNRNQQPPRRLITNTGHITPLRHVWQEPTNAM